MSKRDDELLKDDIILAFRSILDHTIGMSYEDFMNSKITRDAVVRNFEIAGEAANYISPEFKLRTGQIE